MFRPLLQIRKDTSTIEHQLNLHSGTSGCLNRNGHLCIGLWIIVISFYLPLNFHHLLSLSLISIFNVLISLFCKYGSFISYFRKITTKQCINKDNNSDNNFQVDTLKVMDKYILPTNKFNNLMTKSVWFDKI